MQQILQEYFVPDIIGLVNEYVIISEQTVRQNKTGMLHHVPYVTMAWGKGELFEPKRAQDTFRLRFIAGGVQFWPVDDSGNRRTLFTPTHKREK